MTGPQVILTLKVLVFAVTMLFATSLVALARGNFRLHGRINTAFFLLTLTAVLGLEGTVHVLWPQLSEEFFSPDGNVRGPLLVHLWFSVPSALVLPFVFWTGRRGRRAVHITLATLFSVLWIGTFVTGIFYLPHEW
jgi:hypothetical protein